MHQKFNSHQIKSFKRAAKVRAKGGGCTHSEALDAIAQGHGYNNWSLLVKNRYAPITASIVLPVSAGQAATANTSHEAWVDQLEDWFRSNHERAVDHSPWESAEGGFQYPVIEDDGEIANILEEVFPSAPADAIAEAALNLAEEDEWLEPNFAQTLFEPDPADGTNAPTAGRSEPAPPVPGFGVPRAEPGGAHDKDDLAGLL